jgi:hypothetical protein
MTTHFSPYRLECVRTSRTARMTTTVIQYPINGGCLSAKTSASGSNCKKAQHMSYDSMAQ